MNVVPNDKNELIPQRTIIGYIMCIDFRKLNKATRKDHYPLPFIDQMLERLSKNTHFAILMGILASPRFMSTPRIRRIPLSRVLTVLMLIGVCLLVCVMHLLLFRGVCLLYFMVSVRRLWRSSWMNFPSMEPPSTTISTILIKFCRDLKKQIWCSIGRSAISWLTKG